jgi:hypothetical protein
VGRRWMGGGGGEMGGGGVGRGLPTIIFLLIQSVRQLSNSLSMCSIVQFSHFRRSSLVDDI